MNDNEFGHLFVVLYYVVKGIGVGYADVDHINVFTIPRSPKPHIVVHGLTQNLVKAFTYFSIANN
jgi:hypothetical protein